MFIRKIYSKWVKQYFKLSSAGHKDNRMSVSGASIDVFLIFQTERIIKNLGWADEVASTTWNFRICLNCAESTKLSKILLQKMSLTELPLITSIFYGANEESAWGITIENLKVYEEYQDFIKYFNRCKHDYLNNGGTGFSSLGFSNTAIVRTWQVIMNNYTYPVYEKVGNSWSTSSKECSRGKERHAKGKFSLPYSKIDLRIEVKMLLNASENYDFSIPNEMFTLRFISCGRPKLNALAFQELFNVFRWHVWLGIMFAVTTLLVFKRQVVDYNVEKSVNTLIPDSIAFVKPLMEQGQPFLASKNSNCWRISYGVYLLVTIVLSNAYRNTNVYNMVKPLSPIPYETFRQLVNDKFKIFTRNLSPIRLEDFPGELLNRSLLAETNHSIEFNYNGLLNCRSEIQKIR